MLTSILPKLQRQHEYMDAHIMIIHLKELFNKTYKTDRYEISKELFHCKKIESSSVNNHVLKMIGYIEKLS